MSSKELTPPPVIGKSGPYTIFITPPSKLNSSGHSRSRNPSSIPGSKFSRNLEASRFSNSNLSHRDGDLQSGNVSPTKAVAPPPVVVPPPRFEKLKEDNSLGSVFGFFWDAVAKVQYAHSSLDKHLADWLGLDQSRYQWELNDYYENGAVKDCEKPKGIVDDGKMIEL